MGILSYEENYPEYEDRIKCVTNWIRSAKSEIRNKKEEKSLANKQERVDLIEKGKTLIRAEEKYFSKRIKAEIISMTSEKSIFVDDLKKNVSVAQELLEGFTKILIRIETLGGDFLHEFDNTYEVHSKLINFRAENVFRT